ncbi:MAG TPA: hypothetical protein DCO77_11260 [Nitrospiraceae bacterium]|nr:hypothetical protein [Nitrospiraceae bacterium]
MPSLKTYCTHFLVLAVLAGAFMPVDTEAKSINIRRGRSRFSMEFRNAEIRDVLRAVGQAANLNMIIGDDVSGQVTLSLKNVNLLDALQAVLKTKGFTYVREGNILRVLSLSDVKDEDMETRVFPLGYASGKEVLAVVEKVKSDRAKVSVDKRMNALVVKDISLNIDSMERLLKNLDVRTPQVLIEARIVEVAKNYTRELGVQWGGEYAGTKTTISGGSTGIDNAGDVSAIGGAIFYPQVGDIGPSGNAYAVNLPAAVGPGSGGVLGISFGSASGKLNLDLQLSAMVSTGNGKILSSPKILTMNNKKAVISSGVDIPVKVLTATTTGSSDQLEIISTSLSLSTTPTITADKRIAMVVLVEKSEPDFTQTVDGIPTVTKRKANAELVVNDGETVVLGGILTKSEGEYEDGVPFLSKIPLLGWLFKRKGTYDNQAELLIFITPTIVKQQ